MSGFGILIAVIVILMLAASMVKIVPEYERGVVLRLGRVRDQAQGPGIIFLIPFVDRMFRISIRTVTMDVDPQDVISRDNVSIKVNAVIYFRVVSPIKSVINVENYLYATSQLAQTHLRSVLGSHSLDDLLREREKINTQLQRILDENTDPWGIKVEAVEVKQVDLPQDMQRAMAREAESERVRRAKVIAAEGEYQAATKLKEAADLFSTNSTTIQLRYLQTLTDISSESKTNTIVFPLPMDMIEAFTKKS